MLRVRIAAAPAYRQLASSLPRTFKPRRQLRLRRCNGGGGDVGSGSGQKGYVQGLSWLSFGVRLRRRSRPEIGIVARRGVADARCRGNTAIARVIRVAIRRVARRPLTRKGRLAAARERDREIVGSATGILAVVQGPGRGRAVLGNHADIVPHATAQAGGIANPVRSGSEVGFDIGLVMGLGKIAIRRLAYRHLTGKRTKTGDAGGGRNECVTCGNRPRGCPWDYDLVIDDRAIRPGNRAGQLGRVVGEGDIDRILCRCSLR